MKKFIGTGVIALSDYKSVKWVGGTKGGKAVIIKLTNALNMGSMEWTYADKGEIVPEVVFTGVYLQKDLDAGIKTEPFEILTDDKQTAGADEIMLGAGKFYINDVCIGLSRGGGKFTRNATIREIPADNDRGAVKGRVTIDEGRPTLSINAMELLTRLVDIYPAMQEVENGDIYIEPIANITMAATDSKEFGIITVPDGCTIVATMNCESAEVVVSGNQVTINTTAAAEGVYVCSILATKEGHTAQSAAFTVTVTE